MPSDAIKLGAVTLSAPVFNSAGPRATTLEDLQAIADSASGAVVTKSFSLQPSRGNSEPNYYEHQNYSINSIGLQNRGAEYFIEAAQRVKTDKPLIASIVGSSNDDYIKLVRMVNTSGYDAIELNLSCPNVKTKEPLGASPQLTCELLQQLTGLATKPVSIKLPPYVSRQAFKDMADVITAFELNHVVLINTYPLAAAVDSKGNPYIAPNDGIGGLSGPALKPIALAHVMLFRQFSDGKVPIVGVGGIQAPADVREFLAAGATAVQVGTATITHGLGVFTALAKKAS